MNSGDISVVLPDWSVLSLTGADAERFLQGQITSDVRRLTADRALLGAWCEPDGRVNHTFLLLRQDAETIVLLCPCNRGATLAQQLRKYVLRASVRITLNESATVRGRIADAPAAAVPRFHVTTQADGHSINLDDGQLWLDLRATADHQPPRAEDQATWRLREVSSGLPWVPAALAGKFVPQMLNLDLLGELSFDKGCFRGQEIVARLQHRGEAKRRLALFELAAARTPEVGASLCRADDASGSAGVVLAAAPIAMNTQLLLAVATTDGNALLQLGHDGASLIRRSLPYTTVSIT